MVTKEISQSLKSFLNVSSLAVRYECFLENRLKSRISHTLTKAIQKGTLDWFGIEVNVDEIQPLFQEVFGSEDSIEEL